MCGNGVARRFAGALIVVAGILGGWTQALQAAPKPVEIRIGGLTALGDLVVPDGGSITDGVVLITHGTLAHKDMELVETLQALLAERGIATLAHTLTLGLDRRQGMYDCAQPHNHRHEGAVGEIGAWADWLRLQGAGKISHLGHSRGANQVSWYAASHDGVDKVMLLAPAMGTSETARAANFKQRFKTDLAPLLDKARGLVASGKSGAMMDLPGFVYCGASKAAAESVVSYYGEDPRRQTATHFSGIPRPILVIAGSADTVVPDVAERVGPFVGGGKVSLKIIEDAGHMFLDFYAEDAADLVAGFLAD